MMAACDLLMLMICSVANCIPLLIQQKVNGYNTFNRSWAEFKVGFNDFSGNYWLGNELLSQLTANNSYKLSFEVQSHYTLYWYDAEYSTFRVLSEAYNYELLVAGDSAKYTTSSHLKTYHNGTKFTTYDRDNDLLSSGNCAVQNGGGFWYNNCGTCFVNGSGQYFQWNGLNLRSSRMWLQCK